MPKRQRRGPLPTFAVPDGVPLELAGRCFNCGEPEHVVGMCTGKTKCLKCGGEEHVDRNCPLRAQPRAAAAPAGAGASRAPMRPEEGAARGSERARIPVHDRLGSRVVEPVAASRGGPALDAERAVASPVQPRVSAHDRLGVRMDGEARQARGPPLASLDPVVETTVALPYISPSQQGASACP